MSDYSATFPSQRPVFSQDYSNGGKIDPRATFSRASTGTFFGTEKVLSSENIVAYSNDISTKTLEGVTATGGQTAPDGGTDAYKLTENSATGFHRFYEQIVTNGSAITFSAYFKYIGRQWVRIRLTDSGGSDRFVWFDIQNGVAGTAETGFSGASITSSGNGYYKVSATLATSVVSGGTHYLVVEATSGDGVSGASIAGLNADSFAVWGLQVSSTGETILNETSGSIHREYQTKLQTAASGAARFEHSAADGQSEGILIEGSATNLITRSHELDNASWTKGALNVDANAAISVDGTLTADLLRPTTASGTHYALATVTTTASSTYTASAYVKAAGYSKVQLYFYQSTSPYTTESSSIFTLSGSGSATASVGSSTITAVGGGYYRISVTGVAGSSGSGIQIRPINDAGTDNFAGDGYSGIICTGVQFEQNSFPSSLISTSGASATRAAESLSVATADIGYTGGPVTVTAEASMATPSTNSNNRALLELAESGSTANRLLLYNYPGRADGVYAVADGSTIALFSGTINTDDYFKTAVSLDTNSIARSVNGGAITEDTSGQLPVNLDTLSIGCGNGVVPLDGHIKRIAIYSEALSDTNLQALTS